MEDRKLGFAKHEDSVDIDWDALEGEGPTRSSREVEERRTMLHELAKKLKEKLGLILKVL